VPERVQPGARPLSNARVNLHARDSLVTQPLTQQRRAVPSASSDLQHMVAVTGTQNLQHANDQRRLRKARRRRESAAVLPHRVSVVYLGDNRDILSQPPPHLRIDGGEGGIPTVTVLRPHGLGHKGVTVDREYGTVPAHLLDR